MTDEPQMQPIDEHDNDPATKGDVRRAVEELAQATAKGFAATKDDLAELATKNELAEVKADLKSDIAQLENRFDRLEGRFDGLESRFDGMDRRLDRLIEVIEPLPKRIRQLEDNPTFRH